jgi:hypothetical protein
MDWLLTREELLVHNELVTLTNYLSLNTVSLSLKSSFVKELLLSSVNENFSLVIFCSCNY